MGGWNFGTLGRGRLMLLVDTAMRRNTLILGVMYGFKLRSCASNGPDFGFARSLRSGSLFCWIYIYMDSSFILPGVCTPTLLICPINGLIN